MSTDIAYSPSINIVRDDNRNLNYIVTENAQKAFNTIFNKNPSGTRAFSIIGTYGTGKSAFLLAVQNFLKGNNQYFGKLNGQFKGINEFVFLNRIGSYDSLIASFAEYLNLPEQSDSKIVIKSLKKFYEKTAGDSKALIISIDEFGKFLEYAEGHEPEKELYFIQELAEFANDFSKNIYLIVTLHQEFDAYHGRLSRRQVQEWDKVKGRLKEILFNEPVEQLLELASITINNSSCDFDEPRITSLIEAIEESQAFPLNTDIEVELATSLYPLDLLSAAVLTKALQDYGQNERSLFTFLESEDNYGLRYFDKKNNPYYNLSNVYDYLINNFYSYLSTSRNPDFIQWSALQRAIERAEGIFEEEIHDALKMIKTIGLLDRFGKASKHIDKEFIDEYGKLALGIENPIDLIQKLERSQIIRYVSFKNSFILYEGSDLNIEFAIQQAESKIEAIGNVVPYLQSYFKMPYLRAKETEYITGTPRIFEFHFSDNPISEISNCSIDGVINLIFNDNISIEELKSTSSSTNLPILYGISNSYSEIRNVLYEIEKVKKVIEENQDDRVAIRELKTTISHKKDELKNKVIDKLYSGGFTWYFNGNLIEVNNYRKFQKQLTSICNTYFQNCPNIKNELINKEKVSSSISFARRKFFEALISNSEKEDLGFPKDKFPPEKAIYNTLLKKTNIHFKGSVGNYILGPPEDPSFESLWNHCFDFLSSANQKRRPLNLLTESLTISPYKLKRGVLDFWIPLFLIIKKSDYALFYDDQFIPLLNIETIDLLIRRPQDFEIKSFEITGVKLNIYNHYRNLIQSSTEEKITIEGFVDTIKPFLIFYKQLPEYAKKTKRLQTSTIKFREAIKDSKDPEETFFIDFPQALGFHNFEENNAIHELDKFTLLVQEAINEIRDAYNGLIDRIENVFCNSLDIDNDKTSFKQIKKIIADRYSSIKKFMLLPHQKVFLNRINIPSDDRKSWYESISYGMLNKALSKIDDTEEELLFEKIKNTIYEMDGLIALSDIVYDEKTEDVVRIEINKLNTGNIGHTFRIAKKKLSKGEIDKISDSLPKDKRLKVAILTKLLEDEINNE